MLNNDSSAFELSLKAMLKQDINRAYTAYEYYLDSAKVFDDPILNIHLLEMSDIQIELYKKLSDRFYKRYGVYPQNDK